jgi:hypothetical protein
MEEDEVEEEEESTGLDLSQEKGVGGENLNVSTQSARSKVKAPHPITEFLPLLGNPNIVPDWIPRYLNFTISTQVYLSLLLTFFRSRNFTNLYQTTPFLSLCLNKFSKKHAQKISKLEILILS